MAVSGIKRMLFAWLPVVIYCILLYIQSSHPPIRSMPQFSGMDKLMHFAAYVILGGLVLRAFCMSNWRIGSRNLLGYSILITCLYGISDEFHQSFVLTRQADILDAVADTLGGTCGVILYYFFKRGAPVFNSRGEHGGQDR